MRISDWSSDVCSSDLVTLAETAPDPALYSGADPAMLRAGSSLFVPPRGPVRLNDPLQWWTFCFGADWRHPTGHDSSIDTLLDHPVVHIAYEDAHAYARWAGKEQIGRAHVCTPVTNPHLVCRLLLEKKKLKH